MCGADCRPRAAFSLVELVIVVVIIGVLAAIAIPRMSRGAGGADQAALADALSKVRHAIVLYSVEHGNTFPGPTEAQFVEQLTQYSDANGNVSATPAGGFAYGPYLVRIPRAPVGENRGSADVLIDDINSPPEPDPDQDKGWVYNPTTGEFIVNTRSTAQAQQAGPQGPTPPP